MAEQKIAKPPVKLTPVQRKMLNLLSDGVPRTRRELHACLYDESGPLSRIQAHISGMRKVVRPLGEDIVITFFDQTICYRLVTLLKPDRAEFYKGLLAELRRADIKA